MRNQGATVSLIFGAGFLEILKYLIISGLRKSGHIFCELNFRVY